MNLEDEVHLIPDPSSGINGLLDAVAFALRGDRTLHVLRAGQTIDEYKAEEAAAAKRFELGLTPGRTMPTKAEIAAGPVTPEVPVDPRDAEIAALREAVDALKDAGILTDEMIATVAARRRK